MSLVFLGLGHLDNISSLLTTLNGSLYSGFLLLALRYQWFVSLSSIRNNMTA